LITDEDGEDTICKNQNIKIYDSSAICVIYHDLDFLCVRETRFMVCYI